MEKESRNWRLKIGEWRLKTEGVALSLLSEISYKKDTDCIWPKTTACICLYIFVFYLILAHKRLVKLLCMLCSVNLLFFLVSCALQWITLSCLSCSFFDFVVKNRANLISAIHTSGLPHAFKLTSFPFFFRFANVLKENGKGDLTHLRNFFFLFFFLARRHSGEDT